MSSRCKCLRWAFRLSEWEPNRAEWTQVIQSIQEEEVNRVNRFIFREDSISAAVGRLIIRAALVQSLDIPWGQIRLGRNEKGKPILLNQVDQCPGFNIAHDADYVVLATDCGPACGVDVMKVHFRPTSLQKTIPEYLNLMRSQFSPSEWNSMEREKTEKQKLALFYRYWCLKESYVKAIGLGIHGNLASQDFRYTNDDPSTGSPSLWTNGQRVDEWRFTEFKFDDDHVASVCTQSQAQEYCRRRTGDVPLFEKVTITDLLRKAQPLHAADEESYDNLCVKKRKK